jgi:hypothetical protein
MVADPTRRFSFEILLYEDRSKRAVFQYRDIDANTIETGTSATVGKENAAGNRATRVSFNEGVFYDGLSIAPK